MKALMSAQTPLAGCFCSSGPTCPRVGVCSRALWVSPLQVHNDQIVCRAVHPDLLSDLQAGGAGEALRPFPLPSLQMPGTEEEV